MNTAPPNKIDLIFLWLAIPLAGIAAFCAFYFAQYALTDFIDYGDVLPYLGLSALGFALFCIVALALKLSASPYRRVLICIWALITAAGLLSAFPLTNPIFFGYGFIFNVSAPACVVIIIMFAVSIAKDDKARRGMPKVLPPRNTP